MNLRLLAACFVAITLWIAAVHAETKIKIGVLTDLSGPYSDLAGQGSVIAAQLAAKDFAAANPDFRIEIISGDHQNKPDVAVSIARQWIDRDGVDVVADVPNSAAALAVNTLISISSSRSLPRGGRLSARPAPTRITPGLSRAYRSTVRLRRTTAA